MTAKINVPQTAGEVKSAIAGTRTFTLAEYGKTVATYSLTWNTDAGAYRLNEVLFGSADLPATKRLASPSLVLSRRLLRDAIRQADGLPVIHYVGEGDIDILEAEGFKKVRWVRCSWEMRFEPAASAPAID